MNFIKSDNSSGIDIIKAIEEYYRNDLELFFELNCGCFLDMKADINNDKAYIEINDKYYNNISYVTGCDFISELEDTTLIFCKSLKELVGVGNVRVSIRQPLTITRNNHNVRSPRYLIKFRMAHFNAD